MFKNSVFKVSVDTKEWAKKSIIRAIHTMAQTAIPLIPVGVVVTAVDWKMVLGVTLSSGILSMLKSIAVGLPEVQNTEV